MDKIEFRKEIEIRYNVDVFVAGGGPAGVAAAVTAAEMGASVFLAEKGQCFGGAATLAKVPAFMRFSDGVNFLAGGFGRRLFDALYGEDTDYTTIEFSIEVEKLKLLYDQMMLASGASFLFETTLVDVVKEDNRIQYVILKGKETFFAVRAKVYIDGTGDGFMAVAAGEESEKGNENGFMMPGTLCSMWGDIDWSRAVVELGKDPDERFLPQAFKDGVFTVQDLGLPGMWRFDRHYGGGNIGHVFGVDGTDEVSLTKGMLDGRKRIWEYVEYYNRYLPGYENAKLISTGDILGIRESRRITCLYAASFEDYQTHAVFDDEIGRYAYPIDIHSHSAENGKENSLYEQGYEKGKSYGLSYRSLLPKKMDNLLIAGRCIGAEREMFGALRVMPCCFITGMAAGCAAALSVRHTDGEPKKIDVKMLQQSLLEKGAYLPNYKG